MRNRTLLPAFAMLAALAAAPSSFGQVDPGVRGGLPGAGGPVSLDLLTDLDHVDPRERSCHLNDPPL